VEGFGAWLCDSVGDDVARADSGGEGFQTMKATAPRMLTIAPTSPTIPIREGLDGRRADRCSAGGVGPGSELVERLVNNSSLISFGAADRLDREPFVGCGAGKDEK